MKPVSLEVTMMKRIGELNAEASALRAQVARLNHEVLHLKSDVERMTAFTTRTIIPNEFLQAEVERLKNNVAYLDKKLDEELDGPKA